ncbi:MAG: ribonuclease P protein subunit [Candidatus Woesearchaeota archaeon]|jgi:RNase P/RNase MRP subunit p29
MKKINVIGSVIEIIDSNNTSFIGLKCSVIDETKKMFVVGVGGKEKKIIKNSVVVKKVDDGTVIDCKKISNDLISRLKQKEKRK